jgi:ubiquinone/menaquinone biosynthesis C-methylase UbiE
MRAFLRKSSLGREPLALTMTGVRMGERVLQIGAVDARLAALLAAKQGMSGEAAIVTADAASADRVRAAAADKGALVDVQAAPLHALPFGEQSFDAVVLHGAAGVLAPLDAAARTRALIDVRRVLRSGGRLVALEPGSATGLSALLRASKPADPAYEAAGGTVAVLQAAGFKPVRLLADREGTRFIEGMKP